MEIRDFVLSALCAHISLVHAKMVQQPLKAWSRDGRRKVTMRAVTACINLVWFYWGKLWSFRPGYCLAWHLPPDWSGFVQIQSFPRPSHLPPTCLPKANGSTRLLTALAVCTFLCLPSLINKQSAWAKPLLSNHSPVAAGFTSRYQKHLCILSILLRRKWPK